MNLPKKATCLAFITALATALPTRGAPGQPAIDPAVEARLDRMENELGRLRDENQKLRQELGLATRPASGAIKPAGREATLAIGGFVQAQAEALDQGDRRFTSGNDRFYLRRARINVAGKFLEDFNFRLELEFAGSLGETTSMRAQLTDGYINWNRHDFAQVRVGQFKSPYGYEQLAYDPGLFTIERTLVNDRLTLSRQIGVQVAGDGFDKRVSYATGVFNGTGVNTNANDNDDFLWAGRASGIPWRRKIGGQPAQWSTGVNSFATKDAGLAAQPVEFGFDATPATAARDNVFTGQRTGLGVDTQVKIGRFDFWAEYLRSRFEQSAGRTFEADGWYAQAAYFVVPARVQTVLKHDTFDPDRDTDGNATDTWTLGVNYFFKGDDLKVQLDYLRSDIPGAFPTQDKLLLRLQVIF